MPPNFVLAAILIGQSCNSLTGCPSPTLYFGGETVVVQQPTYLPPLRVQTPAQNLPAIKQYEIVHDGMDLIVEGRQFTKGGDVTWDPDRPFNIKALAIAQERKRVAALAAAQQQRAPSVQPLTKPAPTAIPNYGLNPALIGRSGNGGYKAASAEAKQFIAEATTSSGSDSSRKLHVTIIGEDDERARVVEDINTNPAFASIRDNLLVQEYKPNEWAVDPDLGFQPGKPAIIVQTSKGPGDPKGGGVLLRASDYSIGPVGLAEAIRKVDPNYKSANDPSPANGKGNGLCPFGFTRDHWPMILIVGGILAVVIKLPRKAG